jgi:anti-sigma factor RsiW
MWTLARLPREESPWERVAAQQFLAETQEGQVVPSVAAKQVPQVSAGPERAARRISRAAAFEQRESAAAQALVARDESVARLWLSEELFRTQEESAPPGTIAGQERIALARK